MRYSRVDDKFESLMRLVMERISSKNIRVRGYSSTLLLAGREGTTNLYEGALHMLCAVAVRRGVSVLLKNERNDFLYVVRADCVDCLTSYPDSVR